MNYSLNYVIRDDRKNSKGLCPIYLRYTFNRKWGGHPTQKPLEIIERMILSSTKENDLVLDMFCGSGSVLVSCKNNSRRGIGIEKEKKFYELSKLRVNE